MKQNNMYPNDDLQDDIMQDNDLQDDIMQDKADPKRKKEIKAIIIKTIIIIAVAAVLFIAIALGVVEITNNGRYNDAVKLMEQGKFEDALAIFEELNPYKDSADKIIQCNNGISERIYNHAKELIKQGQDQQAYHEFLLIKDYRDSKDYIDCFLRLPSTITVTNNKGYKTVDNYSYTFGEHGLTKVKNTTDNSIIYKREYNTSGKVTKTTQYTNNSSYTRHDEYAYEYNDDGFLIKVTHKSGEKYNKLPICMVSTYEYHENGVLATASILKNHWTPIKYYYNTDGKLVKYTINEYDYTRTTDYIYDHLNNLTEKNTYYFNKKSGKPHSKKHKYLYEYNSNDNITKKTTLYYENGIEKSQRVSLYTYDSHYRLLTQTNYVDNTDTPNLKNKTTYKYHSEHLPSEIRTRYYGMYIHLISAFDSEWDSNIYEYDRHGNLTKYDGYGNILTTYSYKYGQDGCYNSYTETDTHDYDDHVTTTVTEYDNITVYFDEFTFMQRTQVANLVKEYDEYFLS